MAEVRQKKTLLSSWGTALCLTRAVDFLPCSCPLDARVRGASLLFPLPFPAFSPRDQLQISPPMCVQPPDLCSGIRGVLCSELH